ncbi:MAG: efflux RND transporter periplasmic adaptor subunit [Williamsia sp.]|nr:efflux RND transporter periplasmic adaptor subunit [Williamsia sp.]
MPMLCIVAACMALLGSCSEPKPQEPAEQKVCISDSLSKIIRIDSAAYSNVDDELKLSGQVSFNDNKVVKIYPFSSGQVLQVPVSLGDKVSKGQTLAVIRSADVASNYSDQSTAQNDVSIAKRQMENAESLFKNGLSSEREYNEAKENYNNAVIAANKVKEQIAINGGGNTSANGNYILKAPMSGYVVEKKVNQGGFIRTDNSDNLFTVGDINDVWVWANVYESDIAKVKEGYTATVKTLAYPDRVFQGTVDKVNEVLDPETKVMKIRIKLRNDSLLLKPEMFADIMITNKEGLRLIAVPATAIINYNSKTYVVLYHDKCNMEIKEVQVMKTVNDKTYLSSGLAVGDKVISRNQILLFNALKE